MTNRTATVRERCSSAKKGNALFVLSALACGLAANVGCQSLLDSGMAEPIRTGIEPTEGREYLLYRPSSYDRQLAWPLVVVCHGAFPDSPRRQIRHWTELAESRGFLVVAPSLGASKEPAPRGAGKQIARQRADERRILATVRHVRAGHSISDDRIFLHGYRTGARTALHTGLRHPELFRAVSLLQPKFVEAFASDTVGRIDPHQSVLVNYSVRDAITGKHAQKCVAWLRSQGAKLLENSIGPARASDTSPAVQMFKEIARRETWMHIRARTADGDNNLAVQFKLRCSYAPRGYRWAFGDGDESSVAEPLHVYHEPGNYRVSVTIRGANDRTDRRTVELDVPGARVRPVTAAPSDER